MENFNNFFNKEREMIAEIGVRFHPETKRAIPFKELEERFKEDEDILSFVLEAKNSCREYLGVLLRYMEQERDKEIGVRADAEKSAEIDELRWRTHDALVGNFNALRRLCAKNNFPLNMFEGIGSKNRVAYGRIALETVFKEIQIFLDNQKTEDES